MYLATHSIFTGNNYAGGWSDHGNFYETIEKALYEAELNGVYMLVWLCDECYEARCGSI